MTKEDLKRCLVSLFDVHNYTALSTNALYCCFGGVSKKFIEKTLNEMYCDGIINKIILNRHLPNKEIFIEYWILSSYERNIFDANIWDSE